MFVCFYLTLFDSISEVLTVHKNLITFLNLDEQNVEGLKESGGPALCDISHFNGKYPDTYIYPFKSYNNI